LACSKKQETINKLNNAVANEYYGSQSHVFSVTCALRKKKQLSIKMVIVVTGRDFVEWHINIIAACHVTVMWLMITILCILKWTLVQKLYNY
jgi:hypothetical protein